MPLFRCEKCGVVENTAVCNYWRRKRNHEPLLCTECDPEIGAWHQEFLKRKAEGMLIDQDGHLWSKEEIERGALPKHYQIVGEVGANAKVS